MRSPTYLLQSNDSGIITEIYFPKKAAYQGAIFDALRKGFFQADVISYLKGNVGALLEEFGMSSHRSSKEEPTIGIIGKVAFAIPTHCTHMIPS